MIEQLANEKYPETRYLHSVGGAGTLTALTYVLTLGSQGRFRHSRDGVVSRIASSAGTWDDSDPQLGISKQGNGYLPKVVQLLGQDQPLSGHIWRVQT